MIFLKEEKMKMILTHSSRWLQNIHAITFILLTQTSLAQVSVSANGIQFDEGNFKVIEVEGSQDELYTRALSCFHSIYQSPKEVLSVVEGNSITVSAKEPNIISRNRMHQFDLSYSIHFQFKEGKIRVNLPSVKMTTYTRGTGHQQLMITANNQLTGGILGIYNEAGKLKSEMAKSDLESFFNAYLADLKKGLVSNQEEW